MNSFETYLPKLLINALCTDSNESSKRKNLHIPLYPGTKASFLGLYDSATELESLNDSISEMEENIMVNDTVIGRIGTIIDVRKSNIKRYRKMLKNKNLDECTRMHIERELKSEQDCLVDAMNLDNLMSVIKLEFENIKREYCQ